MTPGAAIMIGGRAWEARCWAPSWVRANRSPACTLWPPCWGRAGKPRAAAIPGRGCPSAVPLAGGAAPRGLLKVQECVWSQLMS